MALADLAIANYRLGLLDQSGIVIMDDEHNFAAVVPLESIDDLLIKDDYGYAIYCIDNSLTAATTIAERAMGKFIAVHTDHQLLDAIGISIDDDTFRSAMCDDINCCPLEGKRTSNDKTRYLLRDVDKFFEKKDKFDAFMMRLGFGNFEDSLLQNLDVRDAVLTELTATNKWQLILESEPPMGYDSDEFKTFYALALMFTSTIEDSVKSEISAMALLNEVENYSLADLAKHAIANDSWNLIIKAFSQFEVSHLLSK